MLLGLFCVIPCCLSMFVDTSKRTQTFEYPFSCLQLCSSVISLISLSDISLSYYCATCYPHDRLPYQIEKSLGTVRVKFVEFAD